LRVLLDENVDRRLKRAFDEQHEVSTVPERGWAGMKNGELLEAAGKEFDALVTADQPGESIYILLKVTVRARAISSALLGLAEVEDVEVPDPNQFPQVF
jgi:hypothetical protein